MYCGMCKTEYNSRKHRPKLIPCGHAFCHTCLIDLYRQKHNKTITCSKCKTNHQTHPRDLPVVLDLISIKEDEVQDKELTALITSVKNMSVTMKDSVKTVQKAGDDMHQFYSNKVRLIDELVQDDLPLMRKIIMKHMEVVKQIVQEKINQINNTCANMLVLVTGTEETGNYRNKKEIRKLKLKLTDVLTTAENKVELKHVSVSNLKTVLCKTEELLSGLVCDDNDETDDYNAIDEVAFEEVVEVDIEEVDIEEVVEVDIEEVDIEEVDIKKVDIEEVVEVDIEEIVEVDIEDIPLDKLKSTCHKVVELNWEPYDMDVCYNTAGFSVQDGLIVKNSLGTLLPKPTVFVTGFGHVTAVNESGNVIGKTAAHTTKGYACFICCWNNEQKLVISDYDAGSVYLTTLSGDLQNKTAPGMFTQPYGMCIITQQRQLAVCDGKAKSILILSLPELQLLNSISYPFLSVLFLFNNHLYAANCSFNPDGQLTMFSLPNFKFVKTIGKFKGARSIVRYHQFMFVSSYNKITQLTADGDIVCEVGSDKFGAGLHEFNGPTGLCIFASSDKTVKLMVADTLNKRLKLYSFTDCVTTV